MTDFKERIFHQSFATVALAFSVLAIWALTHEYRGLVYDGQIYAVQALAKLRPALNADLFLQNTTQDRFTIFPRIYAWCISCIGLNPAAMLLTALFSVWFLYAAWNLTAHLFNRDYAWLTLSLLIITGGHYGAFGVFHFLEPYLTARLAAEALIVTALACYPRRLEWVGLLLATGALFVHPLMALPGLLLLISMRLPLRAGLAAAVIGILSCLSVAVAANKIPTVGQLLPIMDLAWLNIVRERSQFLFLQLWTVRDWELSARPFVCLVLTWMTLRDDRVRKLAACAMLVGSTGLLIGGVASMVGPVALLMQGQAWRWMWVTTFVSVVLLLPTACHLWNEDKWGRVCAVLLVLGWSFSADIGFVYASLALLAWMVRGHRWLQSDQINRWAIVAIVVSIIVWTIIDTSTANASLVNRPLHTYSAISSIRGIFGLKIWCILFASSAWYWLKKSKSQTTPIYIACALAIASALLLYEPFIQSKSFGSVSDMNEFADWRRVISPGSTVFVTNGHDSGSFVWFTLERNNYLSPGQSAGVVFSRATALEVRRRSEILLPLVDPSWKMRTSLQHATSGAPGGASLNHYPLTSKSLISVCNDSALGFVISPDNVGFSPVRQAHNGAYRNWNLYDCNRVRALAPVS